MSVNISIIDYGIGNVMSIINALKLYDVKVELTNDKNKILNSDSVIFPGVGSFPQGMKNLKKNKLDIILKDYVQTNKPLLGICLGMQLLFSKGEEFGENEGLNLIKGKVKKLDTKIGYKLPNIKWGKIIKKETNWSDTIFDNINENSEFYFVHSYAGYPENEENILSVSRYYDFEFCSSVKYKNIYGCQFHPEKSGELGLRIIENFIKISKKN